VMGYCDTGRDLKCQSRTPGAHQLIQACSQLFKHGYEGYMKYAYPAVSLLDHACAQRMIAEAD
jgi:hypothetical protein